MSAGPDLHLLRRLDLPARYERLVEKLGPEVVRLLVEPSKETADAVQRLAVSVQHRGEGLLVPLLGESGAGKTSLANNATQFFPREYAPALITPATSLTKN